ncbi:hypothetical protein PF005_g21907 [Phytophthora fragariae]|uniref:Uncharacterized protein n=1 Tax=Phytophthora fragariae TaxID=53985 RepID=A0A6A4CBA0_9STRA|nr:hypothetical protein PF009_g23173 [Phytophthora fragariae]KAE9082229.1 hypothetical protein PF007_g22353 [Phytophthora fragariae]KAE9105337.1 hypothetical protein PF006_g21673 [Phytophthora fragariae]KAE9183870.1 hypothetical protein PF005_g21907 [Phytophthora fragariae]KAE9195053.1 hypothetical protein PF002_g23437 [Phytophthora fragariae]
MNSAKIRRNLVWMAHRQHRRLMGSTVRMPCLLTTCPAATRRMVSVPEPIGRRRTQTLCRHTHSESWRSDLLLLLLLYE